MIDQLPEGQSIGWIQAPLEWIFSHTVRFMGIVRVVIQDGEGFILIRKGKPLVFYFKHSRRELRGNTALDLFKSRPILEFNLCRYTAEEFSQALRICNVEEGTPQSRGVQEQVFDPPALEHRAGRIAEDQPSGREPEQQHIPEPLKKPELEVGKKPERVTEKTVPFRDTPAPVAEITSLAGKLPERVRQAPAPAAEKPEPVGQTTDPVAEITSLVGKPSERIRHSPAPAAEKPETVRQTPDPVAEITSLVRQTLEPAFQEFEDLGKKPEPDDSERPRTPERVVPEDSDAKIIGMIKKLNGIIAISIFNDDRDILFMGDVEIEPLLNLARTMLATITRIEPHSTWGPFVHMTLQIPEGNVIVAPYHENYICILTTRTINIGHIRRILRTLQQD